MPIMLGTQFTKIFQSDLQRSCTALVRFLPFLSIDKFWGKLSVNELTDVLNVSHYFGLENTYTQISAYLNPVKEKLKGRVARDYQLKKNMVTGMVGDAVLEDYSNQRRE